MLRLLLSVLSALLAVRAPRVGVSAALMTFQHQDTDSGLSVVCDRCPPGKYLQAPCTASSKSECAPCPAGSFTELWNYVNKCIRCRICKHNQVVKTPCSPDRDCKCECKDGYYFQMKYEMCVKHSDCPAGHGVFTNGTTTQDTVCQICPSGSFSDEASPLQNCTVHRRCDAAGQRLLLSGSTWHDSVCATCTDLKSRDGADYLREILPAFFVRQKMTIKRLHQLLNKLPSQDGTKLQVTTHNRKVLYTMINTWIQSATAEQLRQLPTKLRNIRAGSAASKLQNKLQQIDSGLAKPCEDTAVEVVVAV